MHATSSFLVYLAFSKYVLDTPLYRELTRIMDEQVQVSRMILTNWLEKGSKYVTEPDKDTERDLLGERFYRQLRWNMVSCDGCRPL